MSQRKIKPSVDSAAKISEQFSHAAPQTPLNNAISFLSSPQPDISPLPLSKNANTETEEVNPPHPIRLSDSQSVSQSVREAVSQLDSQSESESVSQAVSQGVFISLDATHTGSEGKIYSYMYRQTVSRKVAMRHFTLPELSAMTGIRAINTIRKALKGLTDKYSIEVINGDDLYRLGYLYKVNRVKDILQMRAEKGIVIHEKTKEIINPNLLASLSVTLSESMSDCQSVSQSNFDRVDHQEMIVSSLYRKNELNSSDSSSSSLLARSDDRQLVPLDKSHYETVCKIYQNQTGNKWTTDDDDYYLQVQGIAIDHIRAEMRRITEAATRTPGRFKYYAVSLLNEVQKIEPIAIELPLDKQYQRWIDEFNLENDNVWKIPLDVKLDYLQARCEREGVEWNREVAEGLF